MARVSAQEEQLAKLQGTLNSWSMTLNGVQMMASMASDAVKKIDGAVMDCIDSAAELEYTMSAVRAVSGATEEESAQLNQTAKDLGADTVFTASQVAQALETMGLAGAEAEEMISGIPAVVSLASSAGEDLNTMTGIVMDGMNAFGLSGTKAINDFADTLAKAATSSNTTVSVMGESLSYVESTAANLNYSIQDVSVALAEMANNSLKGSVSGSALNTMLTRMSGANQTAAKEMERLGLSMYDGSGQAKSLGTFLGELRTTFKEFGGNAQAAQLSAYKLAGQRGMRGLLSIVNASDEEWQKLTEDIYDYQGAAEEISGMRMDNYTGQIRLLESAWDALKTTVGERYLPVARSSAEVLTGIVGGIDKFVQTTGPAMPIITAAGTGILAVGTAASIGAVAVGGLSMAVGALGMELTAFLGPVAWIAAGVGGAAALFTGLAYAAGTADEEMRKLREESEALAAETDEVIAAHDKLMDSYNGTNEAADSFITMLDNMVSKSGEAAASQESILTMVDKLNEEIPGLGLEYDKVSGKLNMTTDEIREFNEAVSGDEVQQATLDLADLQAKYDEIQKEKEAWEKKRDEGGATFTQTSSGQFVATSNYPEAQSQIEKLNAEQEDLNDKMEESKQILEQYDEQMKEHADAMGLSVEDYEEYGAAMDSYAEAFREAAAKYEESYSRIVGINQEAQDIEKKSADDISENLQKQIDQWTSYQQNLQAIVDSGITIPDSMWADLTDGTANAMSNAQALAEGGSSAIQDAVEKANELDEVMRGTSETSAQLTGSVQEAWNGVLESIKLTDEGMQEQAVQVGIDMVQGLAIGMKDDGSVSEAGKQLTQGLIDQIKATAGTHSPSTITTEVGENIDEGLDVGMKNKKETLLATIDSIAKAMMDEFKNKLSKSKFETYGKNAIQGAIDGANAKRQALVSTYASLAQAASTAYSSALDINSPSKLFHWYGEMTMAGAAGGATDSVPVVTAAMKDAAAESAQAYLDGSEISVSSSDTVAVFDPRMIAAMASASGNRAIAPRPMRAVDPAGSTIRNTTSNGIEIHYAPTITVSGGANRNTIDQMLQEHSSALRQMIRDEVYEIEDSERRWAY